jgi:hypothetical protein
MKIERGFRGTVPISPWAKNGDRNEAGVVFFHIRLLENCPGSGPGKNIINMWFEGGGGGGFLPKAWRSDNLSLTLLISLGSMAN